MSKVYGKVPKEALRGKEAIIEALKSPEMWNGNYAEEVCMNCGRYSYSPEGRVENVRFLKSCSDCFVGEDV